MVKISPEGAKGSLPALAGGYSGVVGVNWHIICGLSVGQIVLWKRY